MTNLQTIDYFSFACKAIVAFQLVRCILPWLYRNFIGPNIFGSSIRFRDYGKWAVITGATEGIGKAYAKQLAKRGLNVVLVSRTLQKLETLATEIKTQYNVQTKVCDVDFTQGNEIYQKIEKSIAELDIGVLVNNVGVSYPFPDYFLTLQNRDELVQQIIKCNIMSVANMCSIVMPQMVERRRGIVINLSSLAAKIPNPMLSFYAASKAFVDKFSEDLQTEYASKGIIVQSVLPGFVATNMSKIRKPTWMAPSADRYAASALNTLGIASHTTGYYPHALLELAINIFESLSPSMAKRTVLKTMENIKKRALKKNSSVTES